MKIQSLNTMIKQMSLALFAIIALLGTQVSDADASVNVGQDQIISHEMKETIALAFQIERDYEQSSQIMTELEQAYEDGQIDAETLFVAALQHEQIKEMLQQTRFKMIAMINSHYQEKSHSLVAKVD